MSGVVIIANFNALKNRPDKLDYFFFKYLQENSSLKITLCENNLQDIKNTILKDDILIVFTCYPNLELYNNKKIYYIYDFLCTCKYNCVSENPTCGFQNQFNYIYKQNFDAVWYKYYNPITQRLTQKYDNYRLFPHMIFDRHVHKDYNLEKKYDILFYGSTFKESYPFRNRLYYLLKKNTDKFNILFLPYTKRKPEKMIIGEVLYRLISQSWLTCACCAISNCLVAKYFEIGLCGSVVLGDYPDVEQETTLKKNMILLDRHLSDEDIINKIQEALSNKEQLKEYSENTKEYISSNYMYENGLQKFEELIQSI